MAIGRFIWVDYILWTNIFFATLYLSIKNMLVGGFHISYRLHIHTCNHTIHIHIFTHMSRHPHIPHMWCHIYTCVIFFYFMLYLAHRRVGWWNIVSRHFLGQAFLQWHAVFRDTMCWVAKLHAALCLAPERGNENKS